MAHAPKPTRVNCRSELPSFLVSINDLALQNEAAPFYFDLDELRQRKVRRKDRASEDGGKTNQFGLRRSVVGLSALRSANSDSVPPSKAIGAAPLLSSGKAGRYWLFCRLSVFESRRVLIAPSIPLRGPFSPSLLAQLLRPLLTPAT